MGYNVELLQNEKKIIITQIYENDEIGIELLRITLYTIWELLLLCWFF